MNFDPLVRGITSVTNGVKSFDRAIGLGSGGSAVKDSAGSSAVNLRAQHGTGMADLTGLHAKRL